MSEMGRPRKELNKAQLAALMRLKPTALDCAAFFECSVDTINRRIREWTVSEEFPQGLTFAQFRDQNMVHTRFSIIRTIIKKAEAGDNTMLIYASKNLCDWNDGKGTEVNLNVNNNIGGTPDEEEERRFAELEAKWKAELAAGLKKPEEPEGT